MSWSKLKQQLESFPCPALYGRVEYRANSYRYLPDKSGSCYISVDKKNVLNMNDRLAQLDGMRRSRRLRMIQISKFLSTMKTLKRLAKIVRDNPGGSSNSHCKKQKDIRSCKGYFVSSDIIR
ncbi:SF0329 family protein [Paenibacillus sp. FSL L8-0709]|uniref:SF0329 family protein n=1 Tax=Paenibacillus sp. FSL L8-0709 TaxID=2975312 RepID=UPI004046CBC1